MTATEEPAFGYRFAIKTMLPASGTGRGFRSTELTIVKIAALAPMHTANVTIAVVA